MLDRRTALLSVAAVAAAIPGRARAEDSFAGFVAGVKAEARRMGVREETLASAFAGVTPNARVIELDHHQAEFTMTWPMYRDRVIPASRIGLARDNAGREAALLARAEGQFGVDRYTILGIWGIESGFGANKGNYRLVEALSTLSWEGRRASYFRKELLNALKILDAGDVSTAKFTGGWAGAMGQPQFMPSSYLQYAVDFDGDGKRDIWDSKADVIGSIGNYLAKNGWRRGEPWGQPVRVPANFLAGGRDDKRSLGEWMRQGVRREDGSGFTRPDVVGAVVQPDGIAPGEGFMVYPNFGVIRRYNPSDFYALAVGMLGNAAA